MKRILFLLLAIITAGSISGQQLVTGNSDFIGLSSWAYTPLLVEAGPSGFYWVSGSYYSTVTHPSLGEVYSDFENIFFIKYDEAGEPIFSNYIRGVSYANKAFSFSGGFTVMATASNDVEASGHVLPLNGANRQEIIANYDPTCKYQNIISIWNLLQGQYVYSNAEMDKTDGSVYIYGTDSEAMEVAGYGMIGQEWSDHYIYIMKYNRDLQIEWVYTAGFEASEVWGSYEKLKVIPDGVGGVVVTGATDASKRAVFGKDTLQLYQDEMGLFAVKLDRNGIQQWVNEGSMHGYGYGTYIHKGMAMKNGDLIMAGVTTTGYFQLGEVELNFNNGNGYANQFVYRMGPDGSVRWSTPLPSASNPCRPTQSDESP